MVESLLIPANPANDDGTPGAPHATASVAEVDALLKTLPAYAASTNV